LIGADRCEHGNRNVLHECNIAREKCVRVVHMALAIRYDACMRAAIRRTLPNNVAALRMLVIDLQAQLRNRNDVLQARDAQLQAGQQELVYLRTWIEKLKLELARLRRMQFGRSSEQLSERIEQLELLVGELEISAAEPIPVSRLTPIRKPVRKPLPQHLPRESVIHAPDATCPDCGTAMQRIGEDVSEMLEYVPARFKVIRHIRPKLGCACCQRIAQVPAPIRPIDRGLPGPGLLAHVAVSKFADSLPLYRQAQIYARAGVELERSTLAGWLGGVALLVQPLVDALGRYVLAAPKLHADDTPVPVLEPGRGETKTGRLWTYVRDDRPAGSAAAAAVWFQYSPDRKGERPVAHLQPFTGILQADGYAGFDRLYARGDIIEAACWAHVRRKFYDIHVATDSPIAAEALTRIGALYAIEAEIRGRPPDQRKFIRQARAGPRLDDLQGWLQQTLATVSQKSALAIAIRYALARWVALTRYRDDGRIEIDNNAAERSLRAVALGRKNYLFAGSDIGGERAAAFYSLIGTAKLNGLDPERYLRAVIERIAEHPINRIDELLPWNLASAPAEELREAA
jgi:transposase